MLVCDSSLTEVVALYSSVVRPFLFGERKPIGPSCASTHRRPFKVQATYRALGWLLVSAPRKPGAWATSRVAAPEHNESCAQE